MDTTRFVRELVPRSSRNPRVRVRTTWHPVIYLVTFETVKDQGNPKDSAVSLPKMEKIDKPPGGCIPGETRPEAHVKRDRSLPSRSS